MSKIYHVLNDYSLEELTTLELEKFELEQRGLRTHEGKIKGNEATCYRNFNRELVYVKVETWEDLNGYELS